MTLMAMATVLCWVRVLMGMSLGVPITSHPRPVGHEMTAHRMGMTMVVVMNLGTSLVTTVRKCRVYNIPRQIVLRQTADQKCQQSKPER